MKVDMSPKAVKERLLLMDELWLLSVKLVNSKKIKTHNTIEFPKSFETGELAQYLYYYHSDLLTDAEKAAYKNTLVLRKIEDAESPTMKKILREKWFSSDEKAVELLKDGEQTFFRKLEKRVLCDNPDRKFLNLCPKCNYLTITPKAKQCRKCFHSWHKESKNELSDHACDSRFTAK